VWNRLWERVAGKQEVGLRKNHKGGVIRWIDKGVNAKQRTMMSGDKVNRSDV
jgi:hypothetical protein